MTSIDTGTNSCDTTGYHTHSCISQQPDTEECATTSIHSQQHPHDLGASVIGQDSTNLTNHFGNMQMMNQNVVPGAKTHVPSFAGIFNKDDVLDTPKAYVPDKNFKYVDDTGLGLDIDDGDISGCESLSDAEARVGEASVLDDSLIRERAWEVLGKKRVDREHYTGSATWPPHKSASKDVDAHLKISQGECVCMLQSCSCVYHMVYTHPVNLVCF